MGWKYFSEDEMRCKCGCGRVEMDPVFMTKLDRIREHLGFSLPIASGFRCSAHNAAVAHTGADGPHTTGHAADIRLEGVQAFQLITSAAAFGFTGIGVSQKGPHGSRYIHLDDLTIGPRPWVWSY